MARGANVIGPNVAKFRYQKGWTQDELVGKLQSLGCYMTRAILANIETRRCIVNDKQIEFFAHVFGVKEGELFPANRHFSGRIVGLLRPFVTRRHCANRKSRTRLLAQRAAK